jgi:hypothetical protein
VSASIPPLPPALQPQLPDHLPRLLELQHRVPFEARHLLSKRVTYLLGLPHSPSPSLTHSIILEEGAHSLLAPHHLRHHMKRRFSYDISTIFRPRPCLAAPTHSHRAGEGRRALHTYARLRFSRSRR